MQQAACLLLVDLLLNPEVGISMFIRKVDKHLPKYIPSEDIIIYNYAFKNKGMTFYF
jgi:hypothetical protein